MDPRVSIESLVLEVSELPNIESLVLEVKELLREILQLLPAQEQARVATVSRPFRLFGINDIDIRRLPIKRLLSLMETNPDDPKYKSCLIERLNKCSPAELLNYGKEHHTIGNIILTTNLKGKVGGATKINELIDHTPGDFDYLHVGKFWIR